MKEVWSCGTQKQSSFQCLMVLILKYTSLSWRVVLSFLFLIVSLHLDLLAAPRDPDFLLKGNFCYWIWDTLGDAFLPSLTHSLYLSSQYFQCFSSFCLLEEDKANSIPSCPSRSSLFFIFLSAVSSHTVSTKKTSFHGVLFLLPSISELEKRVHLLYIHLKYSLPNLLQLVVSHCPFEIVYPLPWWAFTVFFLFFKVISIHCRNMKRLKKKERKTTTPLIILQRWI